MTNPLEAVSDKKISEARNFLWRTNSGELMCLKEMTHSHLCNLLRMINRNLMRKMSEQDDILGDQIDDKIRPGFSGLEESIDRTSRSKMMISVEVHTRLQKRPDRITREPFKNLDLSLIELDQQALSDWLADPERKSENARDRDEEIPF